MLPSRKPVRIVSKLTLPGDRIAIEPCDAGLRELVVQLLLHALRA